MNTPLRSIGRLLALIAVCGALEPTVRADGIPPLTLKVKEQESNRFLVQWRVPKLLPPTAIPTPVFPKTCRSVGERSMIERSSAWFSREVYVCSDGLSGQSIGVDYPFFNATVSTLLRVELLSGDRYAHVLSPGEQSWRVPDTTAGGARAWFREARHAVLGGASHFARNGVHVAFAVVLVLLGGLAISIRLATAFATGHLVALAFSWVTGLQLGGSLAEIGVAAAVALLAGEALQPPAQRRQLVVLVAVAGLVHGLGLARLVSPPAGHDGSTFAYSVLVVLGMDATLLIATMLGSGVRRLVPQLTPARPLAAVVAYCAGIVAVALTLGLPATDSKAAAGETPTGIELPNLPTPTSTSSTPASRRVATQFRDAALQSFVTIAPFEVRHEVLVRLRDVASRIELDLSGDVAVAVQEAVKRKVDDLVAERIELTIDRQEIEPVDLRVDFLSLEQRGVLPRTAPVPESVEEAWLGVTSVYLTDSTPGEVLLTWRGFDIDSVVPATVTDPESSRSVELTRGQPGLLWKNELSEDPTPILAAVAVERPVLWLPLVSLVFLGFAIALGVAALRSRRRETSVALARVVLACAFLLAPTGNVAAPLPLAVDGTPSRDRSKRILASLLSNVYRAFEFPTESASYDHLALSVTGETLTEVYLEHRRAVRLEERGGAKARVEAVEVLGVDSVEPSARGGFGADVIWIVGGTVTHFGHRHFRQNRYDARVVVVPVGGIWKIQSIEVIDQKRLR